VTGHQHDPGGKVRLALMEGVKGDAVFSDDGRYRYLMRRWLGETFPERYILFIGMNPSTADAAVNDPTCAREWTFARREGFDAMVKANVGDYRATHPKMLLEPGVEASSPVNLATIRQAAAGAARVAQPRAGSGGPRSGASPRSGQRRHLVLRRQCRQQPQTPALSAG